MNKPSKTLVGRRYSRRGTASWRAAWARAWPWKLWWWGSCRLKWRSCAGCPWPSGGNSLHLIYVQTSALNSIQTITLIACFRLVVLCILLTSTPRVQTDFWKWNSRTFQDIFHTNSRTLYNQLIPWKKNIIPTELFTEGSILILK